MTNNLTNYRQCVQPLINQTNSKLITQVTADAGYDSNSLYDLLASKGIRSIIPPQAKTKDLKHMPRTLKDHSCQYIQNKGIHAWYTKNNYRRREQVENVFYRYKTIIGRKLMSKKWKNQEGEIHLG